MARFLEEKKDKRKMLESNEQSKTKKSKYQGIMDKIKGQQSSQPQELCFKIKQISRLACKRASIDQAAIDRINKQEGTSHIIKRPSSMSMLINRCTVPKSGDIAKQKDTKDAWQNVGSKSQRIRNQSFEIKPTNTQKEEEITLKMAVKFMRSGSHAGLHSKTLSQVFERKSASSSVLETIQNQTKIQPSIKEQSLAPMKTPPYMKSTQNSKLRTTMTSIFQLKTSLSKLNLAESFEKKTGFFSKRL